MKAESLIKIVAAGWLFFACPCFGQEIELKEKFGPWSKYCLKDAKPSFSKCTVTAGVHANDSPDLWTKVAVSIASPAGDLVMTVRTPLLTYLRNGISVGFDGRQAVRAFVDKCSNSMCESTLGLDEWLMNQIATHDKMSVEYQVADDKSALLVLDLDQILPALHSIEGAAALRSQAIASAEGSRLQKPVRLVVERRKFELTTSASSVVAEAWKAPFQKCMSTPTTKVVVINTDLSVQNKKELLDWTEKSSKCTPDAVVWIKSDGNATGTGATLDPSRMASWTLYNEVSKMMPAGVVPEDGSHVAVLPGPIGLPMSQSIEWVPSSASVPSNATIRSTTGAAAPEERSRLRNQPRSAPRQ